jgi:serine/threonine protein kinase
MEPRIPSPFEVKKVAKIVESKETPDLVECLTTLEKHAKQIGEGGNAVIWVAEGTPFEKVCLKKIKPQPQIIYNEIKVREAGVLTPLTLISFETKDGEYLIMETIEGCTVSEAFLKPSLLPENFDPSLFSKELEAAVTKMHNAGIYHRDLHARNVMINKEGKPVIIDFGTATIGSGSDFTYQESVSSFNPKTQKYEQKSGLFVDDNEMVRNIQIGMNKLKKANLTN